MVIDVFLHSNHESEVRFAPLYFSLQQIAKEPQKNEDLKKSCELYM